jgi:hypothetical protein
MGEETEGGVGAGAEGAMGESGPKLSPSTRNPRSSARTTWSRRAEDESLQIIGSEDGGDKVAFGDRDILYTSTRAATRESRPATSTPCTTR